MKVRESPGAQSEEENENRVSQGCRISEELRWVRQSDCPCRGRGLCLGPVQDEITRDFSLS